MADDRKRKTELLDQLEQGPWPSFVTEMKKVRQTNPACDDLLGQLELSYQERKGHWKHGGMVGVRGYGGGVIGRYSDVPDKFPKVAHGTHKHAKVQAWLKRHPRFVPHFIPTSSSWVNLVERWFGHLDNKAIRRGVFRSVEDLKASIEAFLKAWNQDPQPFVWDRDRRIHPGEADALSANFREDPARLHEPQVQKAEEMTV